MTSAYDPAQTREKAEKSDAQNELAGHLRRGELVLLLGAGVSKPLGLPNWSELVERCESRAGISANSKSSLDERIELVKLKFSGDYCALVREALYDPNWISKDTYPDDLLTTRMLIALGALVMSSVRGSVADVLTLNFDDVLDWYLHLHGFRTQIIEKLPATFRGDVDVRIHHMHGFLPLMPRYQRSDWLVFSREDVVDRLSQDSYAPWPTVISSQFQTKLVLAVGTSMTDIDVDVVLRRAQNVSSKGDRRGYVLNCEMDEGAISKCVKYGLVPLNFTSFEDIPEFLLKVCQRAADH